MADTSGQPTAPQPVIGLSSVRFHRALRTLVADALRPHGLVGVEYGALDVVMRSPGLTNAEIADYLLVTPQVLGRVVAALEGRGLLQRAAAEHRGRAFAVSITAAGEELMVRATPDVDASQCRLLAPLTPAQQLDLVHALELCADHAQTSSRGAAGVDISVTSV